MAQREVSGRERFKLAGIVGHCACFPYRSLHSANQKLNKKKKKNQKLRDHFPKYTCIPLVSILIRNRMLEYNQSLSVFQAWEDVTLLPLPLPQSIP